MKAGMKGPGERGAGMHSDDERITPEQKHGFTDRYGHGPEEGQGHFGSSARLSDQGSRGGRPKGARGQEAGSHGGARREHTNPGSKSGPGSDKS